MPGYIERRPDLCSPEKAEDRPARRGTVGRSLPQQVRPGSWGKLTMERPGAPPSPSKNGQTSSDLRGMLLPKEENAQQEGWKKRKLSIPKR